MPKLKVCCVLGSLGPVPWRFPGQTTSSEDGTFSPWDSCPFSTTFSTVTSGSKVFSTLVGDLPQWEAWDWVDEESLCFDPFAVGWPVQCILLCNEELGEVHHDCANLPASSRILSGSSDEWQNGFRGSQWLQRVEFWTSGPDRSDERFLWIYHDFITLDDWTRLNWIGTMLHWTGFKYQTIPCDLVCVFC